MRTCGGRHASWVVLAGAFLCSCAPPLLSPALAADPPRVALCASGDKKADAVVALMEAELSKAPDLVLLDRSDVGRILKEQGLSLAGFLSAEDAVKAGQILRCDLFAELHWEAAKEAKDPQSASLVAFDAGTGARLCDAALSCETPMEGVRDSATKLLRLALGKWQTGPNPQGRTVCVFNVQNIGLPASMSQVPAVLGDLLERRLLDCPDVAVLERKLLAKYLDPETALTGEIPERLLASAVLLDLDVTKAGVGDGIKVRAGIRTVRQQEIGAATVEGSAQRLYDVAAELALKIAEKLRTAPRPEGSDTLVLEAERILFKVVRAKIRSSDEEKKKNAILGRLLAEAALAQNPESKDRAELLIEFLNRETEATYDIDSKLTLMERNLAVMERSGLPDYRYKGKYALYGAWSLGTVIINNPRVWGDTQEQRTRYEQIRRRYLNCHIRDCRAGKDRPSFLTIHRCATNNNQTMDVLTELCAIARPYQSAVSPVSLRGLWADAEVERGRRESYESGMTSGLSSESTRKLMKLYEQWSSGGDKADRIEWHLAAAFLAHANPKVFEGSAPIVEQHLRQAADLCIQQPKLASMLAGVFPAHRIPAPDYFGEPPDSASYWFGTPLAPLHDLYLPAGLVIRELGRVYQGLDARKIPCPEVLAVLDWYDTDGANSPGAYLEEAARQLLDKTFQVAGEGAERRDRLRGLADLFRYRYGRSVSWEPAQDFAAEPFGARAKLFNIPGGHAATNYVQWGSYGNSSLEPVAAKLGRAIESAQLAGDWLYLLCLSPQPRAFEVRRIHVPSGKSEVIGKHETQWKFRSNRTASGAVKGVEEIHVGQRAVYVPTFSGLICFPADGSAARTLGRENGLPAEAVDSCCEVGEHLFLSLGIRQWKGTEQGFLVRHDLASSVSEILACSDRKEKRSPLDDAAHPWSITSIVHDAPRNRLLLGIDGMDGMDGILWSYALESGNLERIKPQWDPQKEKIPGGPGRHVSSLRPLSDGTYLISNYFRGGTTDPVKYFLWDPVSNKATRLAGDSSVDPFKPPPQGGKWGRPMTASGFALAGNSAYYSLSDTQWVVAQRFDTEWSSRFLAPLDGLAPFMVREYGDKLVAVTRATVWLLEPLASEAKVAQTGPAAQEPAGTGTAPSDEPGAALGGIVVTSATGGEVGLDNEPAYRIWPNRPLRWGKVKPGAHTVTAEWCGQKWSGSVEVVAGKATMVRTFPDAKPLKEWTLPIADGVGLELVWVPPGSFKTGSGRDWTDKPEREITISGGFWMGKYEVTRKQYSMVMGLPTDHLTSDRYAADGVSWNDANEFCAKFSQRLRGAQGGNREARLPTEAEWEYAGRGGTTAKHYTGDSDESLELARSELAGPIGRRMPNPFWLYDMYGGVAEWCQDWDGSGDSNRGPSVDPSGPKNGSERVVREKPRTSGQSDSPRFGRRPDDRSEYIGFRVVVSER